MSTASLANAVVRPVRLEDAEAIHRVFLQPRVQRYTSGMPSQRIDRSREIIERLGPDDHMMVAEVEGTVAGFAGLHVRPRRQRHTAHVGIAVHDGYAGRGLGHLLMTTLLTIADEWLGLVRVDLEVNAENERAIRLYERLGFEREGVLRKSICVDGKYVDSLVMARLRP